MAACGEAKGACKVRRHTAGKRRIGSMLTGNSILVQDVTKTEPLESYWRDHATNNTTPDAPEASAPKQVTEADRPLPVPIAPLGEQRRKSRALSTASAYPEQSISPTHPVLSIFRFIDTFGPLVFPLYRAALLRKRILFVGPPPVRSSCEYGVFRFRITLRKYVC